MSLVETAIAKMQSLPPERQQEVIDFIDLNRPNRLAHSVRHHRHSLY
jgi:hypothetical protein